MYLLIGTVVLARAGAWRCRAVFTRSEQCRCGRVALDFGLDACRKSRRDAGLDVGCDAGLDAGLLRESEVVAVRLWLTRALFELLGTLWHMKQLSSLTHRSSSSSPGRRMAAFALAGAIVAGLVSCSSTTASSGLDAIALAAAVTAPMPNSVEITVTTMDSTTGAAEVTVFQRDEDGHTSVETTRRTTEMTGFRYLGETAFLRYVDGYVDDLPGHEWMQMPVGAGDTEIQAVREQLDEAISNYFISSKYDDDLFSTGAAVIGDADAWTINNTACTAEGCVYRAGPSAAAMFVVTLDSEDRVMMLSASDGTKIVIRYLDVAVSAPGTVSKLDGNVLYESILNRSEVLSATQLARSLSRELRSIAEQAYAASNGGLASASTRSSMYLLQLAAAGDFPSTVTIKAMGNDGEALELWLNGQQAASAEDLSIEQTHFEVIVGAVAVCVRLSADNTFLDGDPASSAELKTNSAAGAVVSLTGCKDAGIQGSW